MSENTQDILAKIFNKNFSPRDHERTASHVVQSMDKQEKKLTRLIRRTNSVLKFKNTIKPTKVSGKCRGRSYKPFKMPRYILADAPTVSEANADWKKNLRYCASSNNLVIVKPLERRRLSLAGLAKEDTVEKAKVNIDTNVVKTKSTPAKVGLSHRIRKVSLRTLN
jgi:hypothetical protein